LKARKHFFKVFSTVRKVLTCGAATQRDETPLARFQRAPLPNGGAGRIPEKEFDRRGPLRFTRGSSQ
jgi:hypothetical protein